MTCAVAHERTKREGAQRLDAFELECLAMEAAEEFEGRDPLLVL